MRLAIIVAMAENRAIGRGGDLPWHLPEDLRHFKRLTTGKPIIMGRRTYETLPVALPARLSIVLTRDTAWRPKNIDPAAPPASDGTAVRIAPDLDTALSLCPEDAEEVFIGGGAEIYREALPRVDRIYLTLIHARPEADTFMPEWDESAFRQTSRRHRPAQGDEPACTFLTLDRIR